MSELNDEKFIKTVENLVNPSEVSDLLFFQKFKSLLPKSWFKKLLVKTSRKTPYIGFIIDPYSLFLFFKIRDVEKAKALLPPRYQLTKAAIFEGDKPDYYFGYGTLNTRGSTFWGVRLESYLIATDTETGLLSWIFFDILSNTIIAIPSEGILDPNSRNAVFTTSSKGDIFVDIKADHSDKMVVLKGNINRGVKRRPDQELWVTGNTSIGHIKDITDYNDDPFAVIFDPSEVHQALDCPPEDFTISANTLLPDFAEPELVKVACFPFTQHYIADSPGCRTYVKSHDDLRQRYREITQRENIPIFSTKSIKVLFLLGILISPLISVVLFILLMLKN
jgi:hypothetical protein